MNHKSEIKDGMRIDWDVPITMDDGIVLRCDIFRPVKDGRYPVLMNYGPYGKGLPFQAGYAQQWNWLAEFQPTVTEGSTNKYQVWEACDPERWVPDGYVCIRVDSRGAGRSPGKVDCFSERETQDYYLCIEWAAVQPWCNGKVGLSGVSYYAMNQWQVAAKRPPHLAAICPFEGAADFYRDAVRHGGILSTFWIRWYPNQVTNVQYGVGTRGRVSPNTGELVAGPETLPDEVLARNRADLPGQQRANTLDKDYFAGRSAHLPDIQVPLLSCANIGGQGLHLRGNIEGYVRSGSQQKWLEIHGLEHWTEYYTKYGRELQKRFYDHFLKGEQNGWDKEPRVQLHVRHIDRFEKRAENEWPLARTQWTKLRLDTGAKKLCAAADVSAGEAKFRGLSESITFWADPVKQETEFTGPVAAKLFVSSTTNDADIFVTLRAYGPNGREVLFAGAVDPNTPLSHGWLRASHRKLDAKLSTEYRPYHSHDEAQPLKPGEIYELDIEIWPTSVVLPKGYRLALTVQGKDYDHGLPEPLPALYGRSMRGCSVFLHDDPGDRDPKIFDGTTTIHTGGTRNSYVLMPLIPKK